MQFLDPLIRFRHTLPEGSDVNDLIRENIKDGVGNLVVSPVCPFSLSTVSALLSVTGLVSTLYAVDGEERLRVAKYKLS